MTPKKLMISSFLSYLNFNSSDTGRSVYEVMIDDGRKNDMKRDFIDMFKTDKKYAIKFFEKEYKDLTVIYTDNRTHVQKNKKIKKTGYCALLLKDNVSDKYLLSFRGSEIAPIEDAYNDFIKTDLVYGIGKIPYQFQDGLSTYKKVLNEFKIDREKLILVGHSLGGGIAQYVSVITSVKDGYVPETYTFNAVGINRDDIFSIDDFLKFEDIFSEYEEIKKNNYLEFFEKYKLFLSREIANLPNKKNNYIESDIDVETWFNNNYFLRSNLKTLIKSFDKTTSRNPLIDDEKIKFVLQKDNVNRDIDFYINATKKIKSKNYCSKRIINYGNDTDLTNSLFNHFGTCLMVEKGLREKKYKVKNIVDNIQLIYKSFSKSHSEIAFIPFFDSSGNFTEEININYISSVIRKIIYEKQIKENNFIADLLENKKLERGTIDRYKTLIISVLKKNKSNIVYCQNIISQLSKCDHPTFEKIWKNLYSRLASPYRFVDIYDVIVWKKEVKL